MEPDQNHIKIPLLIGLLAAGLFGAATPASKALLDSLTSFQLAGLLYFGAAIGVVPVLFREKHLSMPWRLSNKTRLQLMGAILFGGILGPVLLLLGLRLASSASVALWLNLELVATVGLGQLFFRDRLTTTSAIAASGTLGAAILLSASEGQVGVYAGLLVFLACLSWGMDNHLTSLIDGISPAQTTFWKGVVAGPVNLIIGLLVTAYHATVAVTTLAVLVGILAYGMSIYLYIISAHQLGATRSQIVFSSSPFFGVLLSVLLLGESISVYQVFAMALIAGSLCVLVFEQHAHEHRHVQIEHEHWHRHDDLHHGHKHQKGIQVGWHSHWHLHNSVVHIHMHSPDLHHRHAHDEETHSMSANRDGVSP